MRMWWNGRHDSFRSYWRQLRGGSSPLIRTIRLPAYGGSLMAFSHRILHVIFLSFILTAFATQFVYAQVTAIDFALKGHEGEGEVRLNIENPPYYTDSNNQKIYYTDFTVTRTESGFAPKECDSGTTVPADPRGGFKFKTSISYCDSNVSPDNNYNYQIMAFPPPGQTEQFTRVVSIPYKVASNTQTAYYKPLFGTYDFATFVDLLVKWVAFRIGPGVVGLMIIYAGFQYISSQGNDAEVKEAKERIVGSLLGLALLLLIGVIMRILLPTS